jgi:hypothetical protein
MGGWGSGRREYATTPAVEECRHLDIDKYTDAVDRPGRAGPIYWGDPDDPEASVSMVLLSDDHLDALKAGEELETTPAEDADPNAADPADDSRATAIYLDYTVTPPRDDEKRDISYLVPIEYTDCNFGGSRPWFRCPPDAGGCGRRVGKLYLPIYTDQDRFLCRECYDLGYRSSRTSGDDLKQAELRYRRAFAKADAEDRRPHPNGEPYFPDKPKGMHWDTFDDLLADVRAVRDDWEEQADKQLTDLLGRYETEAKRATTVVGNTDR